MSKLDHHLLNSLKPVDLVQVSEKYYLTSRFERFVSLMWYKEKNCNKLYHYKTITMKMAQMKSKVSIERLFQKQLLQQVLPKVLQPPLQSDLYQ